jgi:hypothetical protein
VEAGASALRRALVRRSATRSAPVLNGKEQPSAIQEAATTRGKCCPLPAFRLLRQLVTGGLYVNVLYSLAVVNGLFGGPGSQASAFWLSPLGVRYIFVLRTYYGCTVFVRYVVVSYCVEVLLCATVRIGQARFCHRPPLSEQ